MSEWISVEDRLPNTDGRYITAFETGIVYVNCFWRSENGEPKWYLNSADTGTVTHWMPLPKPPKGEQNEYTD